MKRDKIKDYAEWLEDNPAPEEIAVRITEVNGKKYKYQYLPVEVVEDLLDWFTDKLWDTNSFKFSKYEVDGKEYVSGSLELTVGFDAHMLTRTGAATSSIEELKSVNEALGEKENTSFEATILSLALCNAAKKLGNRFGRSLNGRGVNKVEDKKEMPSISELDALIKKVKGLMIEGETHENAIHLLDVVYYPLLTKNEELIKLADSLPKQKK